MPRQLSNWTLNGKRCTDMHNHLSFGLLDFLRFFYNSGFLLQFQGYFRKGCVLEGMERYDDVCLNSKGSCSLFMLFGSCLDKIAWILICCWYILTAHLCVGTGNFPNSFTTQSTEHWSIKKDQEDIPVGQRQKTSSRGAEHEIQCWHGKTLGNIEIWNSECILSSKESWCPSFSPYNLKHVCGSEMHFGSGHFPFTIFPFNGRLNLDNLICHLLFLFM